MSEQSESQAGIVIYGTTKQSKSQAGIGIYGKTKQTTTRPSFGASVARGPDQVQRWLSNVASAQASTQESV